MPQHLDANFYHRKKANGKVISTTRMTSDIVRVVIRENDRDSEEGGTVDVPYDVSMNDENVGVAKILQRTNNDRQNLQELKADLEAVV